MSSFFYLQCIQLFLVPVLQFCFRQLRNQLLLHILNGLIYRKFWRIGHCRFWYYKNYSPKWFFSPTKKSTSTGNFTKYRNFMLPIPQCTKSAKKMVLIIKSADKPNLKFWDKDKFSSDFLPIKLLKNVFFILLYQFLLVFWCHSSTEKCLARIATQPLKVI